MKKFKSILIYGPPGSGKGTVSKFLNISDEIFHLSTGDIFRALDPKSELGLLANSYLDKGNLIPDDITLKIVNEFLLNKVQEKEFDPEKQYLLLDGIPRTLKQAVLLEEHIDVKYIIALEMKDESKLIERMKNRALLENRKDDLNESVLKNRLNIYKEDTLKILGHYPKNFTFHINADQKKLEVIKDVLIKISSFL